MGGEDARESHQKVSQEGTEREKTGIHLSGKELDPNVRGSVNKTNSATDLGETERLDNATLDNVKHFILYENARTYAASEKENVEEKVRSNSRNSKRKVKRRRRGHKRKKRKEMSRVKEGAMLNSDIEDLSRSYRVSRGLDGTSTNTDKERAAKRRKRRRRRRKRRKEKESKRRERERLQAEKNKKMKMRRKKTMLVIPAASLPS